MEKMILPQMEAGTHPVDVVGMFFFVDNNYMITQGIRQPSVCIRSPEEQDARHGAINAANSDASMTASTRVSRSAASPTCWRAAEGGRRMVTRCRPHGATTGGPQRAR
jgi:hypothetical protein